jgi:indole-3-glycerol phosphate synthase
MNILETIVDTKRREVAALRAATSIEDLREKVVALGAISRPSFRELFTAQIGVLIAEIKPKSPSAGELISESPLAVADLYANSAADAISVLTDHEYFGGSLAFLEDVRQRTSQPILRKEFIIDEYQIYETALSSASAFLLIAAILTTEEIAAFHRLGKSLGLDTLVEVHDEEDMQKALAANVDLIGINNRNLKTLAIDLEVTERLAPLVPKQIPLVSESGIATPADVARARKAGARGILVGTSILRSPDPLFTIAELKKAIS